jgi:SAM-dependent methyltransferase
VNPFPCLGEFGFLELNLSRSPSYAKAVARLKSDSSALHIDVGCCVGQDIRRLVLDGVPSSQIIGLELEQGFIDLGYTLFQDKGRLKTKFLCADILNNIHTLSEFKGKVTSIYLGHVLHVFNREEQKIVLGNLLRLLVNDGTGMLLGSLVGHDDGLTRPAMKGKMTLLHNLRTWMEMWKEVEEEAGFKVKMWQEAKHLSAEERYGSWLPKERMVMNFEVTKLNARRRFTGIRAKL